MKNQLYKTVSITPLNELKSSELNIINNTINQAKKSNFASSKRLGACLIVKNRYLLWREPT